MLALPPLMCVACPVRRMLSRSYVCCASVDLLRRTTLVCVWGVARRCWSGGGCAECPLAAELSAMPCCCERGARCGRSHGGCVASVVGIWLARTMYSHVVRGCDSQVRANVVLRERARRRACRAGLLYSVRSGCELLSCATFVRYVWLRHTARLSVLVLNLKGCR